jgi:hypothetical protein
MWLCVAASRWPLWRICSRKEKQILRLLHVDSPGNSPTWYLDACALPDAKKGLETRLLLSGYDLGFRLDATAVQDALDFGAREKELFKGADMGEDVRNLLVGFSASNRNYSSVPMLPSLGAPCTAWFRVSAGHRWTSIKMCARFILLEMIALYWSGVPGW